MEQGHLEILLEDIRGKFDLVLEGHKTLRQQIEKVGQGSEERDEHLLFLIQTLNTKIDGVDTRLDTKIDGLDARLDAKIDGLDAQLDAKIDGLDAQLGSKIDKLEENLTTKIDGIARDLAEHRLDTEAHGPVYGVKER